MKDWHIRLADEPVLFKAGLSAETLAHTNYGVAVTNGQRQAYFDKLREREAELKARGLPKRENLRYSGFRLTKHVEKSID